MEPLFVEYLSLEVEALVVVGEHLNALVNVKHALLCVAKLVLA